MSLNQQKDESYSALAARAASSGGMRTEQVQKARQIPQKHPTPLPNSTKKQQRPVGNTWNNVNESSSSIARAAALSISKSHSSSLKSKIPTQQIPQSATTSSRMLNSFDLHKQEPNRVKQERVKPQILPKLNPIDTVANLDPISKPSVPAVISQTNSNESLLSWEKHPLQTFESNISTDKSSSPINNASQIIPQQQQRRPNKIKSIFKINDNNNNSNHQYDSLTSISLNNLPLDSTPALQDLDNSLSAPISESQSQLYQLNSPAPSASQQQFLNFPTTLRKEKKHLLSLGSRKSKFRTNGDEFNEDKPWKHHQNIAKLNIIDLNERKRYDGVFVTNKGSYISRDLKFKNDFNFNNSDDEINKFVNSYSLPTDRIHSLVVREIWKRSKLNFDTLTKIWYLVLSDRKYKWLQTFTDTNEKKPLIEEFDDGTLTRDEFIVGMWIIDQCLYGRKLPKVIPKEVWESVNMDIKLNGSNGKKWKPKPVKAKEMEEKGKRKLFKKVVGK